MLVRRRRRPRPPVRRTRDRPRGAGNSVARRHAAGDAAAPLCRRRRRRARSSAPAATCAEEPICIDEAEALRAARRRRRPLPRPRSADRAARRRLGRARRAARAVRCCAARAASRRCRSASPRPRCPCVLALGGALKSTVALASRRRGRRQPAPRRPRHARGGRAPRADGRRSAALLRRARPALVACDLHPDYASTRLAERLAAARGVPLVRVQHHHAHVAACMAEHGLDGPVLGAGLGRRRARHRRDALGRRGAASSTARVPRASPTCGRSACPAASGRCASRGAPRSASLHELFGARRGRRRRRRCFAPASCACSLAIARARRERAVATTSVGRLFDAVAALAGLRARAELRGPGGDGAGARAPTASTTPSAYPLPLGAGDARRRRLGAAACARSSPTARRGVPVGGSRRASTPRSPSSPRSSPRGSACPTSCCGRLFPERRLTEAVRARLAADGFAVYAPRRAIRRTTAASRSGRRWSRRRARTGGRRMCLGIPGEVRERRRETTLAHGKVASAASSRRSAWPTCRRPASATTSSSTPASPSAASTRPRRPRVFSYLEEIGATRRARGRGAGMKFVDEYRDRRRGAPLRRGDPRAASRRPGRSWRSAAGRRTRSSASASTSCCRRA